MKTRALFSQTVMISALALVSLQTLDSCKKDEPESTVADVVNVASVSNLKTDLLQANTLADLPADIKSASTSIGTVIDNTELTAFSTADLSKVILFYQANTTLTADEITQLKNNDPYTYDAVINRMKQMPSFISAAEISAHYDAMLKIKGLNDHLMTDPGVVKDLYAVNCYQGVVDFQDFINTYTIPTLQKINSLKTDALKSASTVAETKGYTGEEQQQIATLLNLTLASTDVFNDLYTNSQKAQHEGGTAN